MVLDDDRFDFSNDSLIKDSLSKKLFAPAPVAHERTAVSLDMLLDEERGGAQVSRATMEPSRVTERETGRER